MRPSRWVLAVTFALSLVAVAGWVTLAQNDGDADPANGGNGSAGAGIVNSGGDATTDETSSTGKAGGESNAEAGRVEAGDESDRPSTAHGLRSARFSGTTIDLDPLGDLLDFGLRDVKSDVEVRTDVLDAVLRESALLNDLGTDEILSVDRSNAASDLERNDEMLSGADGPPVDQLDPGSLDELLAGNDLVELNVVDTAKTAVEATEATSDVKLDDVLNDLDGLRLLDDRNTDDVVDHVNVNDLFAGPVLQGLAVVELDQAFAAPTMDDVLTKIDTRDMGNLDTLVAHDELGLPGGFDLLDNGTLDNLDRLDSVDVLDRLDGRVLPSDLVDFDLNVLEELDTAQSDVLGGLELVELFNLGGLGLRDGLGLGPP